MQINSLIGIASCLLICTSEIYGFTGFIKPISNPFVLTDKKGKLYKVAKSHVPAKGTKSNKVWIMNPTAKYKIIRRNTKNIKQLSILQ